MTIGGAYSPCAPCTPCAPWPLCLSLVAETNLNLFISGYEDQVTASILIHITPVQPPSPPIGNHANNANCKSVESENQFSLSMHFTFSTCSCKNITFFTKHLLFSILVKTTIYFRGFYFSTSILYIIFNTLYFLLYIILYIMYYICILLLFTSFSLVGTDSNAD